MSGDDLQVFLFFLSLAVIFGIEVVRTELASRRAVFAVLAGGCALFGLFWIQIKTIWPPLTQAVASVTGSPVAWFVIVMFALAAFTLQKPRTENAVQKSAGQKPKERISLAAVPPERREGKIFVDSNLEYLVGLVKDRARIQADQITAPYIGKWLGVTGIVNDIHPSFVILRDEEISVSVYLMYNDNLKEQFHLLELKKTISAIGRIKAIKRYDIELEDCQLLEITFHLSPFPHPTPQRIASREVDREKEARASDKVAAITGHDGV